MRAHVLFCAAHDEDFQRSGRWPYSYSFTLLAERGRLDEKATVGHTAIPVFHCGILWDTALNRTFLQLFSEGRSKRRHHHLGMGCDTSFWISLRLPNLWSEALTKAPDWGVCAGRMRSPNKSLKCSQQAGF